MITLRSLAIVAALALMLLLPAREAHANIEAGTSIAVLPLRHGPRIKEATAERIADRVRALLTKRGANVLAKDKSVRLSHNRKLACTSKKCLDDLIALCDARMLVGGRLTREGGALVLQVWLYDSKRQGTGKPLLMATLQDRCSGACAQPAKQQTLGERATIALLAKARALGAPAYVTVQSTPAGGTVRIDGAPMGLTNMTFGVTPGQHVITIEKVGYKLSMHEVDVEAGARGKVSADLQKSDGTNDNGAGASSGGKKTARLFAWITLGTAVGGLAAGIPLIAIDGQQTCDSGGRPTAQCPEQRATLGLGVALTVIGAASAVTSAILFYVSSGSSRSERARRRGSGAVVGVAPWLAGSGAGVMASGRF